MEYNRRRFLKRGIAAVMGAGATQMLVTRTQALSLGEIQVDTVYDGYLTLPATFAFPDLPVQDLHSVLDLHGISHEQVTPDCNVTLLRDAERTALFDVGSGPDFMPSAGELLRSLAQLDVNPEDVTHVVFTHAHPDHLWGVLDDFDDPIFSNAAFLIGKQEWDYWIDPKTVDQIGSGRVTFAVGAKRRLESIKDRISFFGDGEEILPGIAAHATYGHTPGHMAFEVRSGSDAVMIVGDAIGNHHVAFERPQWPSGSDQDPDKAIKTRSRLLDQIAHEQLAVIGFHLPDGGFGRVERKDGAYKFVSENIK
jgi:glyoxylase-like metal-dependent hydrolase (beta-lactamase superfamily II)